MKKKLTPTKQKRAAKKQSGGSCPGATCSAFADLRKNACLLRQNAIERGWDEKERYYRGVQDGLRTACEAINAKQLQQIIDHLKREATAQDDLGAFWQGMGDSDKHLYFESLAEKLNGYCAFLESFLPNVNAEARADSATSPKPTAPEKPSPEGLDETPCSPLLRYKWRVGGTLNLYDSGDIYPSPDGEWVRWRDMIDAAMKPMQEAIDWRGKLLKLCLDVWTDGAPLKETVQLVRTELQNQSQSTCKCLIDLEADTGSSTCGLCDKPFGKTQYMRKAHRELMMDALTDGHTNPESYIEWYDSLTDEQWFANFIHIEQTTL